MLFILMTVKLEPESMCSEATFFLNLQTAVFHSIRGEECHCVYFVELLQQDTRESRLGMSEDHTIFLQYINHESKASGSTIANWAKNVLQLSGVDTTKFKAYSTRSAVSTKAFLRRN